MGWTWIDDTPENKSPASFDSVDIGHHKIEDIDQFEEMLQLADEINVVLKEYIRKNKKNKEAMEEIKELLEDYKRADLIK